MVRCSLLVVDIPLLCGVERPPRRRVPRAHVPRVILYVRAALARPLRNADQGLPTALGIAQLVDSGRPNANYFAGLAKNLGIAYTSTIISLEIIVTALICARIYWMGRRYGKAMGNEVGRAYTSAAAIIVESMLLSTLTGIAYIITFARGDQVEIFFLSIYVMSTVSRACRNGLRYD